MPIPHWIVPVAEVAAKVGERAMPWLAHKVYPDNRLKGHLAFPGSNSLPVPMEIRARGKSQRFSWRLEIQNRSYYRDATIKIQEVIWSIDGVLEQRHFTPTAEASTSPLEVFALLNDHENNVIRSWGSAEIAVGASVKFLVGKRYVEHEMPFKGKISVET